VHEHRIDVGRQGGEAGAERGAHALGPVGRLHGRDVLREDRADGVGRRAHDDHAGGAAAVGEHAQRTPHQRLPVQLDERLGAAHPTARAGGEQQAGGYRLITVCGCS
jgi:hypothetical protein